jgi:DNA polymerase-1
MPVGMVYGFASTLISLIEHLHPGRIFVAFDTKESTFRHDLDARYKAQRTAAPDDFYPQLPLIEDLLTAFQIPILKVPGFEADDICGTLAVQASEKKLNALIVSGDLDYLQLVNESIHLVKLNGKIDQSPIYGPAEVEARFGVKPSQIVDFKSLVGDSSDNFKGLTGCGPKTAAEWIQRWGTLDNILKHKDDFPLHWREKLDKEESYVRQCQTLAKIETSTPVKVQWDIAFSLPEKSAQAFLENIQFRSLSTRLFKLIKNIEQKKISEQKSSPKNNDKIDQLSLF